jgi:hypothetical protein
MSDGFALIQTVLYIRRPDGRSFSEVSDGQLVKQSDGFDSIEDLRTHIRLMAGDDFEDVYIHEDRWLSYDELPKWAKKELDNAGLLERGESHKLAPITTPQNQCLSSIPHKPP